MSSTDLPNKQPQEELNILGLSTGGLAGLSVEQIVNNKTAVTMVMHYYKQLVEQNTTLKNDNNTLKTYVSGYTAAKLHAKVGAILLALSNVLIGFGVNLLTSGTTWPGIATFAPGVCLTIVGLWFSLKGET